MNPKAKQKTADDSVAAELMAKNAAVALDLPFVDTIDVTAVDHELLAKTPFQFARDNFLLPLSATDETVVVVTARPYAFAALDDLTLVYGRPLTVMVATPSMVSEAINKVYDSTAHKASDVIDDLEAQSAADLDALVHGLPEDLLETSAEAPVIRLVNSILMEAAKEKASDIHVEPYERDLAVRFRIDGSLRNIVNPPKKLQPLIVSRVKIMSGLDIAEKRLPQDGRMKVLIGGKEIDIRVSVIPTAHGERLVLRLLDKAAMLLGFDQIGLTGAIKDRLERFIRQPHGVILVSGPTGAGKTTTLYAALSAINAPDKNIITVEDPVEYQLAGVGQMQVNAKIGLTFASGLRSILRQDPDVIMVGEIRDRETAGIAVQASLTGHLVFSTIHTNDAAGAVTRLVDMGIEPFLIASSLLATVAQRLVRLLCPVCKEAYRADVAILTRLGVEHPTAGATLYRPVGCDQCNGSGYRGRTGIYELLPVDDEMRSLITKNVDAAVIKNSAITRGFVPMRTQGAAAALAGVTSAEEVIRVTADSQ
jgi:general secretion pathway protein E